MPTTARKSHTARDLSRARRTVVVAVVLAVAVVAASYPYLGSIAVAGAGMFVVSLIPWRLTTYGRPADPWPLVVPYLITVILFLAQVSEEYVTDAWKAFSRIGQPLSEHTFILGAATSAPVFWLLGLILLCLRTEIGNWMAWVFAVAMGIVDAGHFVFPFLDTGHFGYFSGLYSAILLVPAGWYLGFRLYRASKGQALKRAFFLVLRDTLNPLVLRAARSGRAFSLVRHIGRRTGRTYETPLIVAPVENGFVAELTYGTDVAWYRNVVAAGHCVLVVKGVENTIDGIEPYPAETGRAAFGFPARLILRLLRRQEFRFLRIAKDQPQ